MFSGVDISRGWVCPASGYVPGIRTHSLPPIHETWDTIGYGRQAGSRYPTGMFSSSVLVPVIPWLSENTHCSDSHLHKQQSIFTPCEQLAMNSLTTQCALPTSKSLWG